MVNNHNHSSEGQDSLSPSNLPSSSSTKKKQGGWRAVRYILANETFEKLAAMSLIANCVVYLHTQYNMAITTSAEVFNIWMGFTNFLPLLAAYLADAYVGKFRMLFFGSVASLLGMGFITLGAGVPSLRPVERCHHDSNNCTPPSGGQLVILYAGLGFFGIGSGCLRPCNIAFGADQFDVTTEKGRSKLESFCNWWYFLFTVALVVALTGVVYVQTNVSWFLGFAIPTACFLLSLTIFLMGRNAYIRIKPKGSIICDLVRVVVASSRKRHVDVKNDSGLSYYDPPLASSESEEPGASKKLARTNRFRCLDRAAVITDAGEVDQSTGKPTDGWRLCSVQQVEEFKAILNTLPVWVAGIVCILAMQQTGSFGILQALQTNKSIGPRFSVPPAWMGLVPMIALSVWIFLYEKIYVPWSKKAFKTGRRLSVENRMLIGIVLSIVTMAVSGLIEIRRRNDALRHGTFESPSSFCWLMPQFALSGLVEAFAAITLMELLTSRWPENMKTLGGAVFFLTLSVASYLNTAIIRVITVATRKAEAPWLGGNDLNKNRLEYYYYTIGALAAVDLLYYLFFARRYLRSELLQKSSRNGPQEDEENAHAS